MRFQYLCSYSIRHQSYSCAKQQSTDLQLGHNILSPFFRMGIWTWLQVLEVQYICFLFYRSQFDGQVYIQKKRKELENSRSSIKEREKVIQQLKTDPNHGFLSFFVCRNPVAHMLSVYNHIKLMVETGKFVKFHGAKHDVKKFPSWEEYLRILTWPKNRPLTLVEKKMQTVGLIFKIFLHLLYLNEI